MAPHSGKVCVKKILKLDVTIAGLVACRIQVSQRGGSVQLKWLNCERYWYSLELNIKQDNALLSSMVYMGIVLMKCYYNIRPI